MANILVKVHESYRWVVAVCDSNLFGKKLTEENRSIDISGEFFNGENMSASQAKEEIEKCLMEDATFNFVGEESVKLAKEIGIVKDSGIIKIQNVPIALVLL